MNEKLLGLLRRQEWLHHNAFEQATASNQAAHDAKAASLPFSEDQLVALELNMLHAQIELEREESAGDTL